MVRQKDKQMSELERLIKKLDSIIMRLEYAIDALPIESEDDVVRRIAMEQEELTVVKDTLKTLEGL